MKKHARERAVLRSVRERWSRSIVLVVGVRQERVIHILVWLKVLLWQTSVATGPHVFVIATCIRSELIIYLLVSCNKQLSTRTASARYVGCLDTFRSQRETHRATPSGTEETCLSSEIWGWAERNGLMLSNFASRWSARHTNLDTFVVTCNIILTLTQICTLVFDFTVTLKRRSSSAYSWRELSRGM